MKIKERTVIVLIHSITQGIMDRIFMKSEMPLLPNHATAAAIGKSNTLNTVDYVQIFNSHCSLKSDS